MYAPWQALCRLLAASCMLGVSRTGEERHRRCNVGEVVGRRLRHVLPCVALALAVVRRVHALVACQLRALCVCALAAVVKAPERACLPPAHSLQGQYSTVQQRAAWWGWASIPVEGEQASALLRLPWDMPCVRRGCLNKCKCVCTQEEMTTAECGLGCACMQGSARRRGSQLLHRRTWPQCSMLRALVPDGYHCMMSGSRRRSKFSCGLAPQSRKR